MQNLLQLVPVLREVMKLVAEVSVFVELKLLLWSGWLRLTTSERSRLVVTGFELQYFLFAARLCRCCKRTNI